MSALDVLLSSLPDMPQLRGRRIRLRAPRIDDAPALLSILSDPRVVQQIPHVQLHHLAQAQGRIDEMREGFARRDMLHWLIATRDDSPIGTCVLFHFDARTNSGELGYVLHPAQWNHGYASEAARVAIDFGFRTLQLDRIDALINPRNDASRALALRLGFVLRAPGEPGLVVPEGVDSYALSAQSWARGAAAAGR